VSTAIASAVTQNGVLRQIALALDSLSTVVDSIIRQRNVTQEKIPSSIGPNIRPIFQVL
jgi:hypothetical protein